MHGEIFSWMREILHAWWKRENSVQAGDSLSMRESCPIDSPCLSPDADDGGHDRPWPQNTPLRVYTTIYVREAASGKSLSQL